MRIQASLEFILITSAIAIVSLSVISLYSKNLVVQNNLLGAIANQTQENHTQTYQVRSLNDPQVMIYVPINSTMYRSNNLQATFYGCTYGIANVTLSSPSVFFSKNRSTVRVFDIAILAIAFDPLKQGPNTIDARYNISCENTTKSGSETLYTYATPPYNASPLIYSAYIINRNEKLEYTLSNFSQIINLSSWSYCTLHDFWGNPLPISSQCGTSNSWEYTVLSDYCYITKEVSLTSTHCIVPIATGYNTSVTGMDGNYTYNFELLLSSPFGVMHSIMNGSKNASRVVLNNETVGSASVVSISNNKQLQGVTLISNGSSYSHVNETMYEQYLQAKNILYNTLNYYNLTQVDYSTDSAIQQAVYAFVKASENLRNSRSANLTCSVLEDRYVCNAGYPFTYVINVSVSNNIIAKNQTLYYLGSEINVFSG